MDILPLTYFDNLIKRYWRRRRYQRLDDASNSRKKMKIARLGNKKQRGLKIRLAPKLRFKFLSPIKLFSKFHQAYIDMMIRLAGEKNSRLFGGNKVPKGPLPVVSATSNEVVDGRLVLEIYKRLVSTRELDGLIV